jgi:hypothetical protein
MTGMPDEQGRRYAANAGFQVVLADLPQASFSLAPFAADWVGGDVGALRTLATTLYGFVPEITDITMALDEQVAQLTGGDQGWLGPAAAAFGVAWHRDSVAADALAVLIGRAASIIDALAVALATIENALEEQAHAAARYGVKIGTDGRPPPVFAGPPAGPPADPAASAAAASERHWALSYRQEYEQARADAQQARQHAARKLMDLCTKIEPPGPPLAASSPAVSANGSVSELPADQRRRGSYRVRRRR